MKKSLPIIIVLLLVALGIGAWSFLGKNGKKEIPAVPIPGEVKKEAGEEGESFTGKLKQVITRGVPMKCTVNQDNFSGTSYIKGKKVYSEITQGGKEAFMIMVDKCMWNWSKDENQGVKMCFDEDVWDSDEEGTVPIDAQYNCRPTIISDSKFNPPANINFLDMDQMMEGFGE